MVLPGVDLGVVKGAAPGRALQAWRRGGRGPDRPWAGRVGQRREKNKAIREWARKAKKDVADRGRIPQEIIDECHAKAGRR